METSDIKLQSSKSNHLVRVTSRQWFLFPFCFFTFLLLFSCSGDPTLFKLEGHFKNLNEGEFYIYDINDGWKDTIAVQGGDFKYQRAMTDATTLVLMFPNYSELPILAWGGGRVSIEGDVSHLRETEVTGNEENDELTEFRKIVNDLSPEKAAAEARKFIKAHPHSPACQYLLRRFFLLSATPDYAEALSLCAVIVKAQPTNRHMLRLRNLLKDNDGKNLLQMPEFTAVSVDGDTITNRYLQSPINIVQAWASSSSTGKRRNTPTPSLPSLSPSMPPLPREHPSGNATASPGLPSAMERCGSRPSSNSSASPRSPRTSFLTEKAMS